MTGKEYIESGLLESFVLGYASEQETAEIERLMQTDDAIAQEVASIRESIESYALAHARTPPEGLKEKIWSRILGETQGNVRSLGSSRSVPTWAWAASIALLTSVIANVVLYKNWQKTETLLALSESQNRQTAGELDILKASYVAVNQEIRLVDSPEFKKIKVLGTPQLPDLKAVVYWNKNNQEVYLSGLSQLPTLENGKQYQLWAIVDGKPVDAGLIDAKDSLQKFKSFANAQAFAISLEKQGGSTTAKGPQGPVVALGSV
jgi:anti-sigma-K factor RskA